jgi:hypothetical protein
MPDSPTQSVNFNSLPLNSLMRLVSRTVYGFCKHLRMCTLDRARQRTRTREMCNSSRVTEDLSVEDVFITIFATEILIW